MIAVIYEISWKREILEALKLVSKGEGLDHVVGLERNGWKIEIF